MFLSPEVAIVQHHTSVTQVSGDFFENGATYFAKMCYAQIRFQVSNGECAPFVGHNAFVRWKALQDVAVDTGDPNYLMYYVSCPCCRKAIWILTSLLLLLRQQRNKLTAICSLNITFPRIST